MSEALEKVDLSKIGAEKLFAAIVDPQEPLNERMELLMRVAEDEGMLEEVFAIARNSGADAALAARLAYVDKVKTEMKTGPMRAASFEGEITHGDCQGRARVLLENGERASIVVPEMELLRSLHPGDDVWIDAKGQAVLAREPGRPPSGTTFLLERRIGKDRVQVSGHGESSAVYMLNERVGAHLDAFGVIPGQRLIGCDKRKLIFDLFPQEKGGKYYRFLCQESVPEVRASELGAPPQYIRDVLDHVSMELKSPDVRRRYGLQRSIMKLLAGPTGTGKTYSLYALWRELYELMSDMTGVKVEELPHRVLRLRAPQILSKWLGESDKNLDAYFDELEEIAGDEWTAPDGSKHILPCLAVLEEVDSIARSRGSGSGGGIYDRIMTTALQRLDTSRPEISKKLIIFIATTNVPKQVDAAFLRRVGGTVEHFRRPGPEEFRAILGKHVKKRPVLKKRRDLLDEVTAWLYDCPSNSVKPVCEVLMESDEEWVERNRRHFITPSIVDKAVQGAAVTACQFEHAKGKEYGITSKMVIEQIDQQIAGIVEILHPMNVENYIDVPEGDRVVDVRRLEEG